MIACKEIIAAFRGYLAAHDGYILGTSGQTWTQAAQDKKAQTDSVVAKYGQQWVGHHVEDCSGAFVRAYKACGLSIYHGSNRIAREYVAALLPPSEAKPGMAAFKARKPGSSNYQLPSEYLPGGKYYDGDLNDYYHIGLVDSDPQYVINAQSTQTGVVRSRLSANWCAVGCLKAVDYSAQEEDGMGETMTVNTDKVNMRTAPDISAPRVEYLNKGDTVTLVIACENGWDYVTHGHKSGYVMSQFLDPVNPAQPPADDITSWLNKAIQTNEETRQALIMLRQLLTGK